MIFVQYFPTDCRARSLRRMRSGVRGHSVHKAKRTGLSAGLGYLASTYIGGSIGVGGRLLLDESFQLCNRRHKFYVMNSQQFEDLSHAVPRDMAVYPCVTSAPALPKRGWAQCSRPAEESSRCVAANERWLSSKFVRAFANPLAIAISRSRSAAA